MKPNYDSTLKIILQDHVCSHSCHPAYDYLSKKCIIPHFSRNVECALYYDRHDGIDGIENIIGLNRRDRVHENGHSMVGGLNIWATMAAFPATYPIISKSKFRAGVCIRFHPRKSVLGALICHFYTCAVLRIGRCLLIVHHPEMS